VARWQEKQRKKDKVFAAAEKRARNLDAFYERCEKECENWDECEVSCDDCGQVQMSGNMRCVVCGCSTGSFRNTITM
jgi:hypothetical protein